MQKTEKQQEIELLVAAKYGDIDARNKLIEIFLPLIKNKAYKYRHGNMEIEELVNVGVLGLIDAIDGFDFDRKTRFSTHLQMILLGCFTDYNALVFHPVTLNRTANYHIYKLRKKSNSIHDFTHDLPLKTVGTLAKYVNPEYFSLQSCEVEFGCGTRCRESKALNEISMNESPSLTIYENPRKTLEMKEKMLLLNESFKKLNDTENEIINLKYYNNLTVKEISEKLNMKVSKVNYIKNKAEDKIRNFFCKK